MNARLAEFFESDAGAMSMSRLLMLGSFIITSTIMLTLTLTGHMNEGYFSMYLGAFAGTYLLGKNIDAKAAKAKAENAPSP